MDEHPGGRYGADSAHWFSSSDGHCGRSTGQCRFLHAGAGQRLVKQTVNFDDPGTYHLYYGDESGTPGTILTFFPWPGARRGRRGTGQIVAISLAILADALDYWIERLSQHHVSVTGPTIRFQEQVITFHDPHGLSLELVASQETDARSGWQHGPIPAAYTIRGLASITLAETYHESTEAMLTEVLGFRLLGQEGRRFPL